MTTVYKTMNSDINVFGVYKIVGSKLVRAPEITCTNDYIHGLMDLHHFIKAQDYKRNREWYEANGIKEFLIIMPRKMHTHLEDGIYSLDDETFFNVYGIKKELLLFNKRKWIDKQVKEEK